MNCRDMKITIKVNSEEKEQIMKNAKTVNLPVSQYIRDSAMDHSKINVIDNGPIILQKITSMSNIINSILLQSENTYDPELQELERLGIELWHCLEK